MQFFSSLADQWCMACCNQVVFQRFLYLANLVCEGEDSSRVYIRSYIHDIQSKCPAGQLHDNQAIA